jgi:hypothetical protein
MNKVLIGAHKNSDHDNYSLFPQAGFNPDNFGRYRYSGRVAARLQGSSPTFLARAKAGGTKAVAEALSMLSLKVTLCVWLASHEVRRGSFGLVWVSQGQVRRG